MAAAAHFLIRKKLFNSKYPQLLVAKDFVVAEKKLHLTISGRKYDPGKKAPKKRRTSDVKTAAPKPSTSQDWPQSESITVQQQQGETATDTLQEPVPSQFSSDDSLPDAFPTTTKTFETKNPKSTPKKPKYSFKKNTPHLIHSTCFYFLFTDQEKKNKIQTRELFQCYYLTTPCTVLKNIFYVNHSSNPGAVKTSPQQNTLIFKFFFTAPKEFPIQFITLTIFLFFH